MRLKPILKYTYRTIEILLLLFIAASIVSMGLNSHDSAEMIGMLMASIGLFVWLWLISLPIFAIVVLSFLRCLIPPTSLYKKVVVSLHILNVVLLFMFYIFLPKPAPCDATLMEKHYKDYQTDMYDLVNYVRSALDDSCSINLEYRDDEVWIFNIKKGTSHETCKYIENKQELETVLNTVGLSMQELNVISN